jgi:hypothetical protein
MEGEMLPIGKYPRGEKNNKFRHGGYGTPAYTVWSSMINRCRNPKCKVYPDYGGRGITVCDRWSDFALFLEDMGPPEPGLTLDREDNDGPYCKENCRWVTMTEQNRNRRDAVMLEYEGETKHILDWCAQFGIGRSALSYRLNVKKMTPKEALEMPYKARKK